MQNTYRSEAAANLALTVAARSARAYRPTRIQAPRHASGFAAWFVLFALSMVSLCALMFGTLALMYVGELARAAVWMGGTFGLCILFGTSADHAVSRG